MRPFSISFASLLFVAVSTGLSQTQPASAPDSVNRARAAASQPAFSSLKPGWVRVATIDGKITDGQWRGASAGSLRLQTADRRERSFAQQEVMSVQFAEAPATQPAAERGFVFYLANGSRFAGQVTEGGSQDLKVAAAGQNVQLPLSALAAIRFAREGPPQAQDPFAKALEARDVSEDLLLSVSQGRVTAIHGAVEQITPEGGTFRWREHSVPIRPQATYAVVFARGVQTTAPAELLCTLKDGSVWAGRLSGAEDATVLLATSIAGELRLPVAALAEMRFRSGRVQLLSELPVADYVFEPFAVTRWPYRVNRCVSNRELRIGGETFDRGLGMHSQSRLVYDLKEPYSQLAATIGIDDAVRPRGSVIFRVLADGKEVFSSGNVNGTDRPRAILVELRKPRRLELCVDFGEALDLADHADWGQVRLIK